MAIKNVTDGLSKWFLRYSFYFFLILLLIAFARAAAPVISGNVLFHTDIGRDFYLMQEMREVDPIILIGPAVRGNSGLYHGPLWFYLNYPAFLLSGGNPVFSGYFWLGLYAIAVGLFYFVGKKIFNSHIAQVSTIIYAFALSSQAFALYNPHGVLFLFPLYFYLWYLYIIKNNPFYLAGVYFLIGIITQFHLGFGVYTLFIAIALTLYRIIATKKFQHFFASLAILIPLSTFLLFEVVHGFTQTKTIQLLLAGKGENNTVYSGWDSLFKIRVEDFFIKMTEYITYGKLPLILLVFGFITYFVIRVSRDRKVDKSVKVACYLFTYFFAGYFIIFLPYTSVVNIYYIWGLLPLIILFFVATIYYKTPLLIRLTVYAFTGYTIFMYLPNINAFNDKTMENSPGNWLYYEKISTEIMNAVPSKDVAYFVLSPELYGYSMKYGLEYFGAKLGKTVYPYQKKEYTVVVVDANQKDQITMDIPWVLKNKIGIKDAKKKIVRFPNGSYAIIYRLNAAQQQEPFDASINLGTNFR
jgi:hypothetical protein